MKRQQEPLELHWIVAIAYAKMGQIPQSNNQPRKTIDIEKSRLYATFRR